MTRLHRWRLNRMFVMYMRPLARRISIQLAEVAYLDFDELWSLVGSFSAAADTAERFTPFLIMTLFLDEIRESNDKEIDQKLTRLSKMLSRSFEPSATGEELEEIENDLFLLESCLFYELSDA